MTSAWFLSEPIMKKGMILSTSAWLQNILMEKKKHFFFFSFLCIAIAKLYEACEKQCWVVPTLELIECNLL